jgi:hypothetical protein
LWESALGYVSTEEAVARSSDRLAHVVPPAGTPANRQEQKHGGPKQTPGFMSLKTLSEYSGGSVRALRTYLKHPDHPLPCYRPGGKVLVKKSDFDAWLARFREAGASDVDAIVNDTLRELRAS